MTSSIGSFYEFFAGGGMARQGLGAAWQCLFANDFDHKKGNTYRANWGDADLLTADVRSISTDELPSYPDLVWGSFPCQDLSLAGGGAGLRGERSGTFWPFWKLVLELQAEQRAPKMIVLENVCGTLTSHKGKDFTAICSALQKAGYNFGAVVVDAAHFVPHSRPRLFFIAIQDNLLISDDLVTSSASPLWHTRALNTAYENLPNKVKSNWVWWNMHKPKAREKDFSDLIEENPNSVEWHSKEQTQKLLSMMSDVNFNKVKQAKRAKRRMVGAIYKRTRLDENGFKVQRAEVRFDDVAGCLRTPAGGSSRQLIIVVDGNKIRSRLISSRETARLMGLPEKYVLPKNYNEAYHLTGDGVVVPVVRHLAKTILEPLLISTRRDARVAA